MTTYIKTIGELPKLKDPIFIEGLPGVGNIGRIAVGYLIEQLKTVKFAELFSDHFMPFVLIHQSSAVHVLKNEFFYWKAEKEGQNDIIFFVGDSQSIDPAGHYEIVEEVLNFIEKLGVKQVVTTAGLSVGEESKDEAVIGVVSDPPLKERYSNLGIDFDSGSKIGTIIGASGLFLGLGRYRGMEGICLLGETSNLPEIPDPKTAENVLKILVKMLNLEINLAELEEKIKEMKKFMKKIESVQTKALAQMFSDQMKQKSGEGEELKYIG
ncbi:proteasome assembly chaperone family protein [Candidatus Micrarchaeota archaeon RBG_16_49_10]|nr:MAG: proteasome assembly chaperone family protein [Candidatus Micrarchaeota archaeon RBG_16_49_10]